MAVGFAALLLLLVARRAPFDFLAGQKPIEQQSTADGTVQLYYTFKTNYHTFTAAVRTELLRSGYTDISTDMAFKGDGLYFIREDLAGPISGRSRPPSLAGDVLVLRDTRLVPNPYPGGAKYIFSDERGWVSITIDNPGDGGVLARIREWFGF